MIAVRSCDCSSFEHLLALLAREQSLRAECRRLADYCAAAAMDELSHASQKGLLAAYFEALAHSSLEPDWTEKDSELSSVCCEIEAVAERLLHAQPKDSDQIAALCLIFLWASSDSEFVPNDLQESISKAVVAWIERAAKRQLAQPIDDHRAGTQCRMPAPL